MERGVTGPSLFLMMGMQELGGRDKMQHRVYSSWLLVHSVREMLLCVCASI